jgi:hypothetical protein
MYELGMQDFDRGEYESADHRFFLAVSLDQTLKKVFSEGIFYMTGLFANFSSIFFQFWSTFGQQIAENIPLFPGVSPYDPLR